MKKIVFGLYIFALLLYIQGYSQPGKLCGTDQMVRQSLALNPQLIKNREALENFTGNFSISEKNSSTQYIIPVVFHIMHNYGPENVSKAQVLDALRIINEDFKKLNEDTDDIVPDFQPIAADCQVDFRLAKIDPYGNCTDGITRTATPLTFSADDNVKDIISWNTEKYLNVWIVDQISLGAGGYAYYPGSVYPPYEGVVVLHTQFGSIGTSNGGNFSERTLTHEIGHYLNLAHTWGSSNDCGEQGNCSTDDGVFDTPNTIGNCLTCKPVDTSCGVKANVQNYMDYATCTKMFTEGQKTRMWAALNSSVGGRDNLWNPANLVATGTNDGYIAQDCTPIADFFAGNTVVCTGTDVRFTDVSYNAGITVRSWTFTGGIPSSSSDSLPLIAYNNPGVFTVALTVYSASGNNTFTRNSYIMVLPSPLKTLPYMEGFESATVPGNEWALINNDNGKTWGVTQSASASGSYSLLMNNFDNPAGEVDEIISPVIDMSVLQSDAVITFKVAYVQRNTSSDDMLQLYVSRDCGTTWALRWSKKGGPLASAAVQNSSYVPAGPGDWKDWSTIILSSHFTKTFRFKFLFKGGGGNYLYIDDINIAGTLNNVPVQVFPGNFSTVNVLTVPLDWNSVVAADTYEVHIDTSFYFSSPAIETAVKGYISPANNGPDTQHDVNLLNQTTYFWRVRSVLSGVPSPWSAVFRFFTDDTSSIGAFEISSGSASVIIVPNPAREISYVHLSLSKPESFSYSITDVFGRPVFASGPLHILPGEHALKIYVPDLPGIYLVTINISGVLSSRKILIQ